MSGKAAYVTANFHATAYGCGNDPGRDCQYKFENYLEDFTQLAKYHLISVLDNDKLALFVVFDSSTGRLPWHVPLLSNDIEATRDGINLDRCEFVATRLRPLAPESATTKRYYEALSSWAGTLPKPRTHEEKRHDPEPFIDVLRKAISSDAVCIGEFHVSDTGRISHQDKSAIYYCLAKLRQ